MKPYGAATQSLPHFSGEEPEKLSRAREKRLAERLLALDVDDACLCGCDDDWMSWGGAFGYMPCDDGGPDCPCCDTPRAYREPMFVTLRDVA